MLKTLVITLVMVLAAAGCQKMTGQTAGQNVSDSSITAKVKGKMAADDMLSLTRMDVETENSVVYLTGVVESTDQKKRAEQVAKEVSGVKRVVNHLRIKPSS